MNLEALRRVIGEGPRTGALIHDRTGTARRVEIVSLEGDRLLAVAELRDGDGHLFHPDARVRVELPKESSVVHVPGRVAESRRRDGQLELEIDCPEGAEDRQRRMDARVVASCRVRVAERDQGFETRTVNVSAGGVLIADGGPLHIGDLVDVEMDLPGGALRGAAEVVRRAVKVGGMSSRTNAALRFRGLASADRERLALHVLAVQAGEKAARRQARR